MACSGALGLQKAGTWWERGLKALKCPAQLQPCLLSLHSGRGKQCPALITRRHQEEFPGRRQTAAAAGLPRQGACGLPVWITQPAPLCFTAIASSSASLVSLAWFLRGFLNPWQGHTSSFCQEIRPRMHAGSQWLSGLAISFFPSHIAPCFEGRLHLKVRVVVVSTPRDKGQDQMPTEPALVMGIGPQIPTNRAVA